MTVKKITLDIYIKYLLRFGAFGYILVVYFGPDAKPQKGVWMIREDNLEFVTRGEKSKSLTDDVSEDFGRLRDMIDMIPLCSNPFCK